jgi:hypothetical protein
LKLKIIIKRLREKRTFNKLNKFKDISARVIMEKDKCIMQLTE